MVKVVGSFMPLFIFCALVLGLYTGFVTALPSPHSFTLYFKGDGPPTFKQYWLFFFNDLFFHVQKHTIEGIINRHTGTLTATIVPVT